MNRMKPLLPASTLTPLGPGDDRVGRSEPIAATGKITSACLACKERKTKCSGQQPCTKCVAKCTPCTFDVTADARRKFNRARVNHNSMKQRELLIKVLQTLRHGQRDQVEELRHICRKDFTFEQLEAEITAVQSQLSPSSNAPEPPWQQVLMQDTRKQDFASDSQSVGSSHREFLGLSSMEQTDNPPIFHSPAHRWTTVTDDEGLIMHLISLYFVWEHPTLPLCDRQLFLEDFESGEQDQEFCSPLLVNAICALGSRFSDRPEILPASAEGGLKGQAFEIEAHRLWALESKRPSLTSVQALSMLAWRAVADGQDRRGGSILREATALSHALELHEKPAYTANDKTYQPTLAERRMLRGRNVTALGLRNIAIIYCTAVMHPLIFSGTNAERTFPLTDLYHGREWWRPYPLPGSIPQPPQFWPIFDGWCNVCDIAQEFIPRLYPDPSRHTEDTKSKDLSLAEIEVYIQRLKVAQDTVIANIKAREASENLPHLLQFRAWASSYSLVLYNTLTDMDDMAIVHEPVFQAVEEVLSLVLTMRQKYGMSYAQGILMHSLVLISYSVFQRLEDPRAQPLIEKSLRCMLDMANSVTVLQAVLHVFAVVARKIDISWSEDALDAQLKKIESDPSDILTDHSVLGPTAELAEKSAKEQEEEKGEGGEATGLSDLLDQWKIRPQERKNSHQILNQQNLWLDPVTLRLSKRARMDDMILQGQGPRWLQRFEPREP